MLFAMRFIGVYMAIVVGIIVWDALLENHFKTHFRDGDGWYWVVVDVILKAFIGIHYFIITICVWIRCCRAVTSPSLVLLLRFPVAFFTFCSARIWHTNGFASNIANTLCVFISLVLYIFFCFIVDVQRTCSSFIRF